MHRRLSPAFVILLTAAGIMLCFPPRPPAAQAAPADTQLKGKVDTGTYNLGASSNDLSAQIARLYGFEYASAPGKVLPARVTNVLLKGSAWAAGIKSGDRILFANVNNNSISLIVERNNKLFQANLVREGGAAIANQPAPLRSTLTTLNGNTLNFNQQLAVLSDHQVAIVLDRSASMSSEDCPNGLTRWQWCAQQLANLTQQTATALANGITLLLFSDYVTEFDHVNAGSVPGIFSANQPDGTTRTDLAMQTILDKYLALPDDKSPLVVAVITDGEPTYPGALEKVIIDATKQMSNPNQVSIVFLKVGPEVEGDALLGQMDRDLVQYGAKYDIVSHKSFAELQKVGLIGALVQAIAQQPSGGNTGVAASAPPSPAPRHPVTLMNPPPPGRALLANPRGFGQPAPLQQLQQAQQQQQQQLNNARQNRADLEKQLLGN